MRLTFHSALALNKHSVVTFSLIHFKNTFSVTKCLIVGKIKSSPPPSATSKQRSLDCLILSALFYVMYVLEEESINAYETTGCFKNPFKWWACNHCRVHCDSKIIEMLRAACL